MRSSACCLLVVVSLVLLCLTSFAVVKFFAWDRSPSFSSSISDQRMGTFPATALQIRPFGAVLQDVSFPDVATCSVVIGKPGACQIFGLKKKQEEKEEMLLLPWIAIPQFLATEDGGVLITINMTQWTGRRHGLFGSCVSVEPRANIQKEKNVGPNKDNLRNVRHFSRQCNAQNSALYLSAAAQESTDGMVDYDYTIDARPASTVMSVIPGETLSANMGEPIAQLPIPDLDLLHLFVLSSTTDFNIQWNKQVARSRDTIGDIVVLLIMQAVISLLVVKIFICDRKANTNNNNALLDADAI